MPPLPVHHIPNFDKYPQNVYTVHQDSDMSDKTVLTSIQTESTASVQPKIKYPGNGNPFVSKHEDKRICINRVHKTDNNSSNGEHHLYKYEDYGHQYFDEEKEDEIHYELQHKMAKVSRLNPSNVRTLYGTNNED